MRVPLLDLGDEYRALAEPLQREIAGVLASQRFILGPKVQLFEDALATYCGSANAVGMSSGTDALLALLMCFGIGPGDAVITTAYTFFATAGCISRLGAKPIFIDIDPATFNISPAAIERYLSEHCERRDAGIVDQTGATIRAIMPVHLFGLCCDMQPILDVAQQYNLHVLEDAAQAIGAEYSMNNGTARAGTMGDAGFFSFYPSKNLGAAGDAGAAVCREAELAKKLRICRQHGMEERYFHNSIGGNFRLDEIQAAILAVKLPFLEQWSAARRGVADRYRDGFSRIGLTSRITLPAEPYSACGLTNHHIYHQYVIRTEERDALREHLLGKEIATAIYYPLGLHQQNCFAFLDYREGALPETERAARESLALPIFPTLTQEAQNYVVKSIAEFFA
ncbi:MAG: DegT/DnrJ/EryC1/StrS family aminotransferase [Chthoniobacterales bacterium]